MAKKLASVALRKKSQYSIKHTSKRRRLKTALKNIFTYLKSDAYMFAPLLHPQFYPTSAPPYSSGEDSWEPDKEKERKLVQDVREYLISDSYMYAPLVKHSAHPNLETGSVCDEMAQRREETANSGPGYDVRHNRRSRIVVRHNMLQKETVKRRISSAPGEVLLQKEKHKIVVE